jgi:acyl carrier protein
MSLTAEKLAMFVADKSGVPMSDITEETPLFSTGLLDSVSMIDLILLIEREANLEVWEADVTLDNFDRIDRILAYIGTRNATA